MDTTTNTSRPATAAEVIAILDDFDEILAPYLTTKKDD